MKNEYFSLIARIKSSLADMENVIARIDYLLKKYQISNDDGYLDGVALNLHGFYSGIERIFKDIALNVEKTLPNNPEWHSDLLLQLSEEIPTIRPIVISKETRTMLDEYRGFRHLIRNIYTLNIRPSRLLELTKNLNKCFEILKNDLKNFTDFLENIA
jgi:hypothetical protein